MSKDEEINKELLLEVLGTVTKLREDFPYTLLLYILSPSQAMNFLDIFAGVTVTFPTKEELLECFTFAITQKYGGYDQTPREVLGGLTRKRYLEMLDAVNRLH